ncbi:tripartite tricarboxylate transporter substrate-binding protein [Variovorax ureilyticus]|uniref:Tripartite tricarboxylate transporter substrate-binding protein n=1 Tax=Variovorax ureilyticus TaxID=1836198 RepID=A0ABU8VPK8_9BURK
MDSNLSAPLSRRHALATIAACLAGPAFADAYPARPVKLVVGYAPGGSVDVIGRIVANVLAASLRQAVVVDNQAGAAGAIGAQRVALAPADGYTLLAGTINELAATLAVNPAQKYDPRKDFTPIALVATAPVLLVASPRTGVKNLDEFFALVKRNPGKYSYGTSGVGSLQHFAGELVKQRAGVSLVHVPYRSGSTLTTDLVGGAVDFAGLSPTVIAPFLQGGRIVPLGVTSATRWPGLPQVPALGEHPLLKGYDLSGWFALEGPRNLPPDIVQRLRAAWQEGLQDPAVRKRLEENGALAAQGNEDLAQMTRDDVDRFAALAKFANIRE